MDVELVRNSVGDWVVKVQGRQVVGIICDETPDEPPAVVVWDARGEADERVFLLFSLFPDMRSSSSATE
jgi:hypothetical protein